MKLIFKADWQAMEGSNRLLVFGVVIVKLLGACYRGVEKYFVKAVDLVKSAHDSRRLSIAKRGITIW